MRMYYTTVPTTTKNFRYPPLFLTDIESVLKSLAINLLKNCVCVCVWNCSNTTFLAITKRVIVALTSLTACQSTCYVCVNHFLLAFSLLNSVLLIYLSN